MSIGPHHHRIIPALFCIILLGQKITAQDFVINHDFQKDKTVYYKVGDHKDTQAVKEITVKKSGHLTLKVDNFNPFVYSAKVIAYKKPMDEHSSYLGTFVSGLIKGAGASGIIGFSRGNDANALAEKNLSPEMQKKLEELNNKAETYLELKQELKELKYDTHKSEAEIKSAAKYIVVKTYGKDKLDPREMRSIGRDLDKTKKEIKDQLGSTTLLPISFSDELAAITELYNEIIYTDFSFFYTANGSADISELKLQVFARADTNLKISLTDTISKYFPIETKNNLRLRNSVGVAFTYFKDKNRSYYVKPDMTIGSGSGDFFTPVLSTFINFYNYKSTGFEWGGSFGFGIPLIGEKKDINFMLGLCTVLGRNEPIIVSAGVAGTKVERLTKGWQVGQTVPSLSFEIPTLSQFRLGAYLSISFNLNNISGAIKEE